MKTIEYFMWGYQLHFLISVKVAAESIFKKLDQKLIPKVSLLGILMEDRNDRHPICIEPEDCGYQPEILHEVFEQAKHYEAIDEDRHRLHSHPIAQERHEHRIKIKALKTAVEQVINRHDYYNASVTFSSWPILVEGYNVFVVLQFERRIYESHYSLSRDVEDGYYIETSLLNATIREFLRLCSDALKKPEPGASPLALDRETTEVIRAAGKSVMYTPANAGKNMDGIHGLFDACNVISSMRYEGSESVGRMIIARKNHPNIEATISFISPVKLHEYRAARKLLEMSGGDISLLCDSAYIYGLGRLVGVYDHRAEDLFTINFTKHYSWELIYGEYTLMQVSYNQPHLPKPLVDQKKFFSDVRRIFNNISEKQLNTLWENVLEATTQKHGTMIVVSEGAEKEAHRLGNQSTGIEPLHLTPHLIQKLTAIDGAILISPDSTCYAIGVILDGLATQKGTPSRGARYNSAIRYVETTKYPCLAIVISEDGTIDLVPNLIPQIKKSTLNEVVNNLRQVAEEDEFNRKKYSKSISWLDEHRFYLSPTICKELNELKKVIDEKHLSKDTNIRIIYRDFIPNDEMNDSCFLDEEEIK